MLASLPMYDLPALRAATDLWWAGLARHLRRAGVTGVPRRLTREPDPARSWGDARLLFSQTCGYPLTHSLASHVRLLCTPAYAAPGCVGARYASVLVVGANSGARRLADLRGGVCAVNAVDSHSGYNVLRRMVAPLARGAAFFSRVVETGGHAASLRNVGAGRADLCAVDCVTHALLARYAPEALAGTRALGFSPDAPGLPYIVGPRVDPDTRERLRGAIDAALADPALAEARAALLISGVEDPPLSAYEEITDMERAADAMDYPQLR